MNWLPAGSVPPPLDVALGGGRGHGAALPWPSELLLGFPVSKGNRSRPRAPPGRCQMGPFLHKGGGSASPQIPTPVQVRQGSSTPAEMGGFFQIYQWLSSPSLTLMNRHIPGLISETPATPAQRAETEQLPPQTEFRARHNPRDRDEWDMVPIAPGPESWARPAGGCQPQGRQAGKTHPVTLFSFGAR